MLGVGQAIDELAENKLIDREFGVKQCALRGPTRSCFLVVFSPDRSLMASTHGDHNIYVTQVKSGDCVQTLKGHPRTPWCIAFHPSYSDIIASGCLGGQVRVWDLHCGSELWVTDGVIASLAFHPVERLLVIATFNELHFWDWSQSKPAVKIVTSNDRERVRYVKFDKVGHQLITGIANLTPMQSAAAAAAREVNDEMASDMLRARDSDERRYNVILDRYERMFDRMNRDLEWPETGARRVVDQPELIQAAVTAAARAEAAVADPTSGAADSQADPQQAPAASRLLSDIAAAADSPSPSGSRPSLSERLSMLRQSSPRPRYMRYSLLLDREDLERGRGSRDTGDSDRSSHRAMRQRGRDWASRLRRTDSFRDSVGDSSHASRRQELRERMLELRRLRDINRETSGRWSNSPFRHSSGSGFVPVHGSERRLDVVTAPERGNVLDGGPEDAPLSSVDTGHGHRIPVWTGAGLHGHRPPQSRQTFMEEFLRSENSGRSLEDIHRMLSDDLTRDHDRAEVQRVTLSDSRDNNNTEQEQDPLSPAHDDDHGFLSRSYRAMGPDTRAVLLRRRQARALAERLMRRTERQRLVDNIIEDELSLPRRMSPPVSIPLLTPTQIADRLDSGRSQARSPAAAESLSVPRSPARSPGRSADPMLNIERRPSPRPHRGRRSTADGPSTGLISDRLSTLQAELSSSPGATVTDNPFTSRPPSSASEVEIDLASTAGSTVSSPVPRPLTARGRYSVDIQGEELARAGSADTLGRSSVDSGLRRSFSSDVNVDIPVLADPALDDDDMFASDSSSSRPNSRQNNVSGGGSNDSRRLIERSITRSRQLLARRPSLSRLHEEEIPFERAASASQALAPVVQSPAPPVNPPEDIEIESDVPLDTFDSVADTTAPAEDNVEELPTAEPLELLQSNDSDRTIDNDESAVNEASAASIIGDVGAEVEVNTNNDTTVEADASNESNNRQQELSRRTHRDVSLLSRHIDHMLRICRAPVTDPTLPRPRREIIRLQGIRRMLEDLQRQIRQLQQAAAGDGDNSGAVVTPEPMTNIASGPSLRPYQVAQARTQRRTLSGSSTGSSSGRSVTHSTLTRAHTQLVSQLRATVRAMESEDGQDRAVSPPSTPPMAASSPIPPSIESTARNDLRAMSQRLERLLRQRRELMERLGNEIQQEVDSIRDNRDGADYVPPLVSSSSQSEDEDTGRGDEPGASGAAAGGVTGDNASTGAVPRHSRLRRTNSSRIPVRLNRRAAVLLDYYDQETYLRNRRVSSSVGAAGGENWRPLTTRERLDIRAGLRRESERERVRLARERDLSLRRLRYGELGTAGADRFPPLRELILRRLRGRNDEEEELLPPSTGEGTSQETRDR